MAALSALQHGVLPSGIVMVGFKSVAMGAGLVKDLDGRCIEMVCTWVVCLQEIGFRHT